MTKYLLLFFSFFAIKHTYAQEYNFDFEVNNHYIKQNQIKKVNLKYDLNSPDNYLARPIIEDLNFQFYSNTDLTWYDSFSSRVHYPVLGESMFLKFPENNFSEKCLKFEIQNMYTFEKFYTPCKRIWGKYVYVNYLKKINQNLLTMIK